MREPDPKKVNSITSISKRRLNAFVVATRDVRFEAVCGFFQFWWGWELWMSALRKGL